MQPDETFPLTILEAASASLDITVTQRKQIEGSYAGVGSALCESDLLRPHSPHIQAQGSFLLGTVVKPTPDAEFDVDGTCLLSLDHSRHRSSDVYNAVFKTLTDHGTYKNMVEPKNRCVRVNYADERFHLDMTPCVPNAVAPLAVHVPDRELKVWKPSNPQLYAKLFEEVAVKQPRLESDMVALANSKHALSARIDSLPPEEGFRKKLLKRLVQLMKRHRDIYFEKKSGKVISIIMTTLAAKAYGKLVEGRVYPSLLDFAIAVVDDMPTHIKVFDIAGLPFYMIENPAVEGENFSDKWNSDATLPNAFDRWHSTIRAELRAFRQATLGNDGTKVLIEKTAAIYGQQPANLAAREIASRTGDMHRAGAIHITPALSIGATGIKAKPTSYYGT